MKADEHRGGMYRQGTCVLLHVVGYGSGGDMVPHHRKLQAGDIHVYH